MHLSILIGSNRPNLLACARIAQASSWAGPDVEVIVRDNSGDPQKRALLAQFQRENCNIIVADPCDALTNISAILRLAKGEFVYILSDDDFCFDHAIAALPGLIEQFGKDPSVAGVTGAYVVEASKESAILTYQDVESDDVSKRVVGYLSNGGPNIFYYSPVRRAVVERVFAFMNRLPFVFSFHDQIISMLYLLNGKFIKIQRLLYLHDLGVWEGAESSQNRDLDFYKAVGLDPAINMLHWFLSAFEGAALIRNADDLFPDYPLAQRQPIADHWFLTMFVRFRRDRRLTFGSSFADQAERLRIKLDKTTGQLSFQNMLAEISNFIALFSEGHAQRYFDFWDAVVNQQKPTVSRFAAAGQR